jgi:hypothetical protein
VQYLGPHGELSGTPVGSVTEDQTWWPIGDRRQQACDACFAEGSPIADSAQPDAPLPGMAVQDSQPATESVTAFAALAVVLGGYGGALRAETKPSIRRQLRL